MVSGTNFVHHFLKPCLAITLCWMAKRPNKTALVNKAWVNETCGAESIDFGTI